MEAFDTCGSLGGTIVTAKKRPCHNWRERLSCRPGRAEARHEAKTSVVLRHPPYQSICLYFSSSGSLCGCFFASRYARPSSGSLNSLSFFPLHVVHASSRRENKIWKLFHLKSYCLTRCRSFPFCLDMAPELRKQLKHIQKHTDNLQPGPIYASPQTIRS